MTLNFPKFWHKVSSYGVLLNSTNIRVRKNHWAPFWGPMGSMWYFVEVLRFRWYLGRNIMYFHALTFNVVATTAGRCHYHRTRIYSYFVAGIPIFAGSYPLVNMEVAVPRYSPNIAWMESYQDPSWCFCWPVPRVPVKLSAS